MKKIITIFLIFVISCGPSDEEIQRQIDAAVQEAITESSTTTVTSTTTTTTTSTTTTTTIDYVSLCNRNINEVYRIKNLIQPVKASFIDVLGEYLDSDQDNLNADVRIAAREFYGLVELCIRFLHEC